MEKYTYFGHYKAILLEFFQLFGEFKNHSLIECINDLRVSFNLEIKVSISNVNVQQKIPKILHIFYVFTGILPMSGEISRKAFSIFLVCHYFISFMSFSFTKFKIQTSGRIPQIKMHHQLKSFSFGTTTYFYFNSTFNSFMNHSMVVPQRRGRK